MNKDLIDRLKNETGLRCLHGEYAVAALLEEAREAIEAQSEPSYTSRKLAEMVMSDCGHSTNSQRLLDRIAERIEKHTESVRAELTAAPPPAQPVQEPVGVVVATRWNDADEVTRFSASFRDGADIKTGMMLYTTPQAQPAQPLTREQFAEEWMLTEHITHATERQIAYGKAVEALITKGTK